MSVMRQMNECTKQRGMCGHEKTMAVAVMLIAAGAAYWFFA